MNSSRIKVLIKNIFGTGATRAVSMLITLTLIPLTVKALTIEEYAIFAVAVSISIFVQYADLGLSFSIINAIASKDSRPKSKKAIHAVSTVWFTLNTITIFGIFVVIITYYLANLFLVELNLYQEAIFLTILLMIMGIPSGIIQRTLFAQQKIIRANIWMIFGRLGALVGTWIFVHFQYSNVLFLVCIVLGIPMLINWLSVLVEFFIFNTDNLKPSFNFFEKRVLKKYLALGFSFMILSSVPYFETGIDVILISTFLDNSLVLNYDIYLKLFTYVPAIVSIASFPLWPSIANALSNKDLPYIHKIKKISYIAILSISIIISFLILIFSDDLIKIWINKELQIDFSILFALSTLAIFMSFSSIQAMVLNGLGIIKKQFIFAIFYILILIIFKILFILNFGLSGMIWSFVFIYSIRIIYFELLIRNSIIIKKTIIH